MNVNRETVTTADSDTAVSCGNVSPTGEGTELRLKARGLRKAYGGRVVVSDVSIEVGPGEVVGLLGPNGAGKTTSFYMIVGLIHPDAGNVFIGDQDVTGLPVYGPGPVGDRLSAAGVLGVPYPDGA